MRTEVATVARALDARALPATPTRQAASAWPVPTIEHVWIGLALTVVALGSALYPIEPIDYWWTVRLGDLIRQHGGPLPAEPLMHTPVRDVSVDGQWLARAIISRVHGVGGIELSLALRTLVAVVAATLLLRLCRRAGAGARSSALVVCLAAILILPNLAVRPQLLALVPFLMVLGAAMRPPRSVPALVVVGASVAFWTNVHGSFVLLYPIVGAGVLDPLRRRWRGEPGGVVPALRLALICAVAPLVNPYGPWLVTYVADAILFNGGALGVATLSGEFLPPTFATGNGTAFFASVLAALLLIASGRRPRFFEALLLLVFGLLALTAVRYALWWSLVLAPFAARAVGDAGAALSHRRAAPTTTGAARMNAAILATFAVVVVASLPWFRGPAPTPFGSAPLLHPDTPIAVAEHLAAHPGPGELFHAADWGGYFGWRLGPARGMFIDDRMELHPPEVWRDYLSVSGGHAGWEAVLERYGVGQLALDRRTQGALVRAVHASPDWEVTYDDGRAVVFARRTAAALDARTASRP